MDKVYYIGSYKTQEDNTRSCSQACINKMNYIIDLIRENDYEIEILSTAESINISSFYRKEERICLNDFISINQIPAIKTKKYKNQIHKLIIIIWLIIKLIQVPQKSRIILYHGLEYIIPLSFIFKIKKFNIVLELEEIYSKMPDCKYSQSKELNFINKFDKIIYVSDTLKNEIGKKGFSIYGNYNILQETDIRKINNEKQDINLLYAGSIDEIRGVFPAVDTMYYLPNQYKLYISGIGNERDILKLKDEISKLNEKKGEKVCCYLGNLSEEEYITLLKNSDIALNTQIDGIYSSFLFPSKIINYLRLGLPIVTTPGNSIINSPFKDVLYISKSYNSTDIAKTILGISNFTNDQGIKMLKEFHNELIILTKEILNITNNKCQY